MNWGQFATLHGPRETLWDSGSSSVVSVLNSQHVEPRSTWVLGMSLPLSLDNRPFFIREWNAEPRYLRSSAGFAATQTDMISTEMAKRLITGRVEVMGTVVATIPQSPIQSGNRTIGTVRYTSSGKMVGAELRGFAFRRSRE